MQVKTRKKIPVGLLGATGMAGQRYLQLLENHPWFDVVYLAASPRSAGMKYREAVSGRWHMDSPMPKSVEGLTVQSIEKVKEASKECALVFSAVSSDVARNYEELYAKAGCAVVSNASAHRWTKDVPMVIPEINPHHLELINIQRKKRKWKRGCLVTKPNCSLQSYLIALFALDKIWKPKQVLVTTLQALSGAGHPGVASLDAVDNVVPFIKGEEDKSEKEPSKILGHIHRGTIALRKKPVISATCTRVPCIDGHLATVSVNFEKKPTKRQIIKTWRNFRALPQELELPSAPESPILYLEEDDRPQPRKDRMAGKGMAVTVGRLRPCPIFDHRFVCLSHNTIRGAAGGGVLIAELLLAEGYVE